MSSQASGYKFGTFRFDTSQQVLRNRSRRVRLSASLIKLLTLFLSRPGELVTREQIADSLWEDQSTVDVVIGINTAVGRLRSVLDDDPAAPRYIETVIGLGYRFIADVEELEREGRTASVAVADRVEDTDSRQAGALEPLFQAAESEVQLVPEEAMPEFESRNSARSRFRWIVGLVVGGLVLIVGVRMAVSRHRSPGPATGPAGTKINPIQSQQITSQSEDNGITAAAVSPDGHVVVYADRFGVSVHSVDNGTDVLATAPPSFITRQISWYPIMWRLTVSGVDRITHRNMVWRINLGSTPQMLFSDAGQATVSPDGNSIAYTRMQDTEIWVADGNGLNSRLLVPRVDGEAVAGMIWSPKSNRLVFDRVSAVLTGKSPSIAANLDAHRSASYESVDASTGKLLSKEQNIRFDSGFLLNDGTFVFAVNGDPGGSKLMLVKTDPDTGRFLSSPKPVAAPQGWNLDRAEAVESLSASMDGRVLGAVLTMNRVDVYWAQILLPGPRLGEATRLTGEISGLPTGWSPDGDAVIFDGYNGEDLICRQRLGETNPEILAKLPENAAMANYSPDGKWILFTEFSGFPGHAVGIFSIPAGGGAPRQLSTTGTLNEFHCSASSTGSCVMREIVDNREFVFYALDPVKGMGEELARAKWYSTLNGDWTLSPDGMSVAMADHDPDHPGFKLFPLSSKGSKPVSNIPVRGFGVVLEPTWASDGKGFFVETRTASGYDLLYVDRAGHAKVLREAPILTWGVPSRDGKKLAFPGVTVRSNVWVGHASLGGPGS